jgi:phosphate/phosphite/phosphonate ABC transporter binding protein
MKSLLSPLLLILLAFLLASCGSPAEPYFTDGTAHYENGEYEEAIADFTEAIRADPNHVASYQGRGLAYYALGQYDQATEDHTEAIRLDADSAVAYAHRGAAYLELGQYEESISDCTEAIRLDPDLAIAYCARGGAYLQLGSYDEAMSDCSEALRLDPNLARAYSNRAAVHNELGDYEAATSDCTEAIRLNPELTMAYYGRGVAHYELGNYEQAIQDCTEALRLDPTLASTYRVRANAHIAVEEYEEAISDCTEAILLEPNLAVAYTNRAVANYELGNYEETKDDCNAAIQLDPDDAEAYFYRCRAGGQLGEEEALEDCTEAINLEPTHAGAYTTRGVEYLLKGDYEQAMADYNEAIRLDPDLARAYYNRGYLHSYLGEFDEAIDDFTAAIRLDPRDAWAYLYRGLAYYALDEYEEAIADYTKAVSIDPDLAEAYHARGLAHYYLGDYEQASEDRAAATRLNPDLATDFSDLALTAQDVPEGFEEMSLADLGMTEADLTQGVYEMESFSAFVDLEHFEVLFGLTMVIPTGLQQAAFDVSLQNPDFLMDWMDVAAGMEGMDVPEQKEIPDLDDIGEVSAGLSLVAGSDPFPMRMDMVMFRRDMVGAGVFLIYADGDVPVVTVGDLARKLDHKLQILWPGTGAATTPEPQVGSPERPVQLIFAPTADVAVIESAGESISNWMTNQTGIHFEVSVPSSYVTTIEAMCAAEGDAMAFIPGLGFVLANDECDVKVALATIRYGRTAYWTEFVALRDSGIKSLRDLEGKRWAVPSLTSTSGYLWPSVLLSMNDITPGETVEAGGHPQAVLAVLDGTADFATSYFFSPGDALDDWSEGDPPEPGGDFTVERQEDGTYKVWQGGLRIRDARVEAMTTDARAVEEIAIIAVSERIPNDTVSFVADFPIETRDTIIQALIDYAATEEGQTVLAEDFDITGFGRVDDSYYDPVRNAVSVFGWTEEDIPE